jgi:hypothetical protein
MEEWGDCGFTDEMSIEVGGYFGPAIVWREQGKGGIETVSEQRRRSKVQRLCAGE